MSGRLWACGLVFSVLGAACLMAIVPGASLSANSASEPGVCQGCQPPLLYHDGPVMATSTLTITPVYWAPPGFAFPGNYVSLMNTYISDIAAASGATSNTYSILPEYYQVVNGARSNIAYQFQAGAPILDTNPYPPTTAPCSVVAPYTTCTTRDQLQAELASVIATNHLTADINHLYVLFFPPGTQTMEGTDRSVKDFCGIHGAFDLNPGPGTVVYADEPYITEGCWSGQSPNGNVAVDAQTDTLSHEIAEAVTDPGTSAGSGWFDGANPGNEIGDECSYNYGPALGSTDAGNAGTTQYNQVINGDKYYTQTFFSNASYKAKGQGNGCIQTAFNAGAPMLSSVGGGPTPPALAATATLDASPTKLAADGASTSTVTVEVIDGSGEPVVGDHIHFDVRHTLNTEGNCGTLSSNDGVTNDQGDLAVTYTASTDNVACMVMAMDAEGGVSDSAIIYQGTADSTEPTITDASVPTSITPGSLPRLFSATASNPTHSDIADARFDLFLTGDNNGPDGTLGLTAAQVHLAYADANTGGLFVNVPLEGETIHDGEITAHIKPDTGNSLPAGSSRTVKFRLSLAGNAPTTKQTGTPLGIEIDLDQFDPADNSQSNLDYIGPADVPVLQPCLRRVSTSCH